MLLQKNYNIGDVVTFKLNNGEEVITRIDEEGTDHYMLNKPMVLIPGPNNSLGLAPLMFSVDPKEMVRLNKQSIALQAETVGEIASQYLQQTTGLTLATAI